MYFRCLYEVFDIIWVGGKRNYGRKETATYFYPFFSNRESYGILIEEIIIVMEMHCSNKRREKNAIYLKKKNSNEERDSFSSAVFAITNVNQKAISPPVAESPVWIGSSRFLLKITVTTCRDRTRHFHWLVSRALPKHVRSTLCRLSLSIYLRCPSLLTLCRLETRNPFSDQDISENEKLIIFDRIARDLDFVSFYLEIRHKIKIRFYCNF